MAAIVSFDCKGNQKKINEAQIKLDEYREKILKADVNGDKNDLQNTLGAIEFFRNELEKLKAERLENKCDLIVAPLLDTQICLSSSTVKRKL